MPHCLPLQELPKHPNGSHATLATGKAQLLHTASEADDDNSDSDGASTDTTLLSSHDSNIFESRDIEEST